MLTKTISPGDKLELQSVEEVQLADGTVGKKKYKTSVYDIVSDDRLEIVMPMEQTKLVLLPVDGEYDVCFFTKGGMYQCFIRIIERYKNENTYVLVAELTSNLRRYQRREYYRFSCILEMKTRMLKEEEVDSIEKNLTSLVPSVPILRAVIVDISGGGLRFISKEKYASGVKIMCNYNLEVDGIQQEFTLVGKVLSCSQIPNRPGEFEHRVEYININSIEREEIIKYIFDQERKNRKKEKG